MNKKFLGFILGLICFAIIADKLPATYDTVTKVVSVQGLTFSNLVTDGLSVQGTGAGAVTLNDTDGNHHFRIVANGTTTTDVNLIGPAAPFNGVMKMTLSDTTNGAVSAAVEGTDYLGPSRIDNTAYNSTTWDGVTDKAPSWNAVRDKFESLSLGSGETVLFRSGATLTISSTDVETSLVTNVIAGGSLGTNRNIILECEGTVLNNTSGTSNFVVRVHYGSAVMWGDTGINLTAVNFPVPYVMRVKLNASDNAAIQKAYISFRMGARSAAGVAGTGDASGVAYTWVFEGRGTATQDSTTDLGFSVTVQPSASHANLVFTRDNYTITLR